MAIIQCPNCGAENKIINKKIQECEYCGTILQIPFPIREIIPVIDDKIDTSFTTSNTELKKNINNMIMTIILCITYTHF